MVCVLDCTLRDGGYYCDWDFDQTLVGRYLAAVEASGIDIVELGFRYFPRNKYLGPYAYTTDNFLATLALPPRLTIAVMVDAKEILSFHDGVAEGISKLFAKCENSPVDIVRIAVNALDAEKTQPIVQCLCELGYRVIVNLMQVGKADLADLEQVARTINSWDLVEVLYFADSLGNMTPESVGKVVDVLLEEWEGPLGIHAHDNKRNALVNTLSVLDRGVTFVDSTILGMGRGAGNVRTENLLIELNEKSINSYYPDALYSLVLQEFEGLHKQYQWGPNLYYFLSATYGIHPTYAQEMLGGEDSPLYDTDDILSAIGSLRKSGGHVYSLEAMSRAISGDPGTENGAWDATGWLSGKNVLIVGTGSTVRQHIHQIENFVKTNDVLVLCLNINEIVPNDIITAYVACYETRILIQAEKYSKIDKTLIIPLSRVSEEISKVLGNTDCCDYGMRIEQGSFDIFKSGCILPRSLAGAYALAMATAAGAETIYLVGMDGYSEDDPRQKIMAGVFEKYNELPNRVPVVSLTPTTYSVDTRSLYEPSGF